MALAKKHTSSTSFSSQDANGGMGVGGNGMGRFDNMNPQEAEQYFRLYPGAAPGGTGETGLAPNDADGYYSLQDMQRRYLQARNPNTTIKVAPSLTGLASDDSSNLGNSPNWWLTGNTSDPLPAASTGDEARNEDQLPLSLRGLYRAQWIKQQHPGA